MRLKRRMVREGIERGLLLQHGQQPDWLPLMRGRILDRRAYAHNAIDTET